MLNIIVSKVQPFVNTQGSIVQTFDHVTSAIVKNISTILQTLY
jgi:hypothetical protein